LKIPAVPHRWDLPPKRAVALQRELFTSGEAEHSTEVPRDHFSSIERHADALLWDDEGRRWWEACRQRRRLDRRRKVVRQSLAAALHGRGATVASVASRRIDSARDAARLAGGARATTDPAEAAREADVVVLSVPDDAIADVCGETAAGGGFAAGDVAIHCSGALGAEALGAARACGAHALAFHPIQSFARVDATLLEGIVCSLEGGAE